MLEAIFNPNLKEKTKRILRSTIPLAFTLALIPLAATCGGKKSGTLGTLSTQPTQPTQSSQSKYEDSGNKITDATGTASLTYPSGERHTIQVRDKNNRPLPNIVVRGINTLEERVIFYYDANANKDNKLAYSPGMKIISRRAGKYASLQQPDLETIQMEFLQDLPDYGFALIEFLQNPPRWDKSKITRFPVQYLGNMSFAQAKNANTILRNTSALITIASAGTTSPVTIPIVAVTAKVDLVLDIVDNLLDVIKIKDKTGLNLDRNRAFEIYGITGTPIFFFIPTDQYYQGYSNDIKDYAFMSPGSTWRYLNSSKTQEIRMVISTYAERGRVIKDKVAVSRTDGMTVITGFEKETVYLYGQGNATTGEFFSYTPPVVFGNNALSAGKLFQTTYTARAETGPSEGTTQQARHTFRWLGMETVKVYTGTYTDAWNVEETLTFGGKTTTHRHWLVKDIGTIKTITADGREFLLFLAKVDNRKYGQGN